MLEEKEINEIQTVKENAIEEAKEKQLALLPLDQQLEVIADDIIKAENKEELQNQFGLFGLTQSKKNALRIIKLNKFLAKVEDEAIERFDKRPDQVTHDEIMKYIQVVSTQIDRSQKIVDDLKEKEFIVPQNTKVNVENINIGTQLDSDSKERVTEAVKAILKQLQNPNIKINEDDVIDAEVTVSDEEKSVYNNDTPEEGDAIINIDETQGE